MHEPDHQKNWFYQEQSDFLEYLWLLLLRLGLYYDHLHLQSASNCLNKNTCNKIISQDRKTYQVNIAKPSIIFVLRRLTRAQCYVEEDNCDHDQKVTSIIHDDSGFCPSVEEISEFNFRDLDFHGWLAVTSSKSVKFTAACEIMMC